MWKSARHRTREALNSESVFQDHRMHACGYQQDSQDQRSSQQRECVWGSQDACMWIPARLTWQEKHSTVRSGFECWPWLGPSHVPHVRSAQWWEWSIAALAHCWPSRHRSHWALPCCGTAPLKHVLDFKQTSPVIPYSWNRERIVTNMMPNDHASQHLCPGQWAIIANVYKWQCVCTHQSYGLWNQLARPLCRKEHTRKKLNKLTFMYDRTARTDWTLNRRVLSINSDIWLFPRAGRHRMNGAVQKLCWLSNLKKKTIPAAAQVAKEITSVVDNTKTNPYVLRVGVSTVPLQRYLLLNRLNTDVTSYVKGPLFSVCCCGCGQCGGRRAIIDTGIVTCHLQRPHG